MPGLTPSQIASLTRISNIHLSPDGSKLLYELSPYKTPSDSKSTGPLFETSSIWIVDDTTKSLSARQLTSGLYRDHSSTFHPDGKSILFLSDRHGYGEKGRDKSVSQLYTLPLSLPSEAIPITPTSNQKSVEEFKVSPCGRYVAFVSSDEPTAAEDEKEKNKDDANVWSESYRKDLKHLRLLTLKTRTISTVKSIRSDMDVASFFWAPDSKTVLYRLAERNTIEMVYLDGTWEKISVGNEVSPQPTSIKTLPRTFVMGEYPAWFEDGTILHVDSFDKEGYCSSNALKVFGEDKVVYLGEEEDAAGITPLSNSLAALSVNTHLSTRIDLITSKGFKRTLYQCADDETIGGYDIKLVEGDNGKKELVFAAYRESGPRREVGNIWIGRRDFDASSDDDNAKDARLKLEIQLTENNQFLADANLDVKVEPFFWKAEDGTKIEGVMAKPSKSDGKPLPTILAVHGGPYHRDTLDYAVSYGQWRIYLASHGYCVLSPNYRGGSGRGNKFAKAAQASMGTLDWTDTLSMLHEALSRKISDPERLGICGWSQGGFMTAWGVSQTKNLFKAAVMGAGVSDWGSMAVESDLPDFEMDLGGSAPWTPSSKIPKHPRGDAINHCAGIETAVLIIHGEKDARVPVSQATGYMRGIRREGKYPERSDLVIYPREPHQFREKKHVEDVLTRVLNHFDKWLG